MTAGFNGNGKYGRFRAHSLKKFFTSQLKNHGIEDSIVEFFTCHKISEVQATYWRPRVDVLRKKYAERQECLNPYGKGNECDPKEFNELKELVIELRNQLKEVKENSGNRTVTEVQEIKTGSFDSKIVTSTEDIIKFSNLGYGVQKIDDGMWLMKKEV